jgi:hypothetical protein
MIGQQIINRRRLIGGWMIVRHAPGDIPYRSRFTDFRLL